MEKTFSEKAGKIILVDPSGPVRQLMSDVAKQVGYTDIQGVASVKDAFDVLEVEEVAWILTPLCAGEPVNALHLLKICTEVKQLRGTRVTLLLEEEEQYCLPTAFELGMLSWHSKPFTKDSLLEEIETLLKNMEAHDWSTTLTSADLLREVLKKDSQAQKRLDLEEQLVEIFPTQPKLLFHLAEAQFLAEKKDEGQQTVKRILTLDPEQKDAVTELVKEHLGEDAVEDSQNLDGVNVLNLETCVLIDSDEQTVNATKEVLEGINVGGIQAYDDGEAAWEWLKENEEPSLIIHEWRIPKIAGPLMIQKIRSHGHLSVPLVVISSLIEDKDKPLLREMGVAHIINKPVDKTKLLPELVWTVQQNRVPTEPRSMELKIQQHLAKKEMDEAQKLIETFLADEKVSLAKKKQIEAELAYAQENYEKTRDHALESLKLAGDSILILNLLGKSLMKLREFDVALKCFEKAQQISPLNIERLCSIAEVQTELGNEEEANEAVEEAKQIDDDSEKVAETEAKVALAQGDTERAKSIMQQLDSLDDVVSFMNNRAVALARTGQPAESLELYQKAIASLPDDRTELIAIVSYNTALANIRAGELEDAIPVLDSVIAKSKQDIRRAKANSLKKRIQAALEKGETLELREDKPKDAEPKAEEKKDEEKENEENKEEESRSENDEVGFAVQTQRGDMCCYLIYTDLSKKDEKVSQLLANMPRFNFREAIERAETLGAEKLMKKSS